MQHFANSWFWRFVAVAFVGAVAYLGWSLAGERTVLPVANAGGVFGTQRPGFVFTTNEAGDELYAWPLLGAGQSAHLERWSFREGTITYRPLTYVLPGMMAPGAQGGTVVPPIYPPRQPLPPSPQPGGGR